MISRLLILLLVIPSLRLSAQSKYKEGVVVNTAGDTLKGLIDYRAWHQNPESILFAHSNDSKDVQRFTVDDLLWFSVTGYTSYTSFVVPVSLNSIEFGSLSVVLDTAQVIKRVFLKDILRGDRVTLYAYTDKIKERFYVMSDRDKAPRELGYGKTLQDLREFEHAVYKRQLQTIAVEYNALTEQLNRKIQSSVYSESGLKGIVMQLNTLNEKPVAVKVTTKNQRFGYFVNVGIAKSKLKYKGKSLVTVDRLNPAGVEQFRDEVTTDNTFPVFSAGVDFFPNPITRRFIIRGELSASKIESSTTSYSQYNYISPAGTENTYKLSMLNITLSPQMLYNFYTTKNVNCYVGAGASFSIQRTSENIMEQKRINQASTGVWVKDDYFHMKSTNLNGLLRGGLQFFQRFDCSVIWTNPTKYTTANSGGQSIQSTSLIFSVGYLINRSNR